MPQKTDAVIAELMDRRLLNDVDPDLHQEIAKAVVKAVHTASLQGEDAVERVELPLARAINDVLNAMVDAQEEMTTTKISARILGNGAVRAILATSLVPDEVAIRADHVRRLEDLLKRVLALGETGGWRRMPDQALFSSLPLAEDIKAAIRSGGGK